MPLVQLQMKQVILGELGDTLAKRADKLRAKREREEAERREDLYQRHRQDMLLDDDGEHWDRWG